MAVTATTPGVPDLRSTDDSGNSSSDNLTQIALPGFSGTCTNGDTVTLIVDGATTAASAACSNAAYTLVLVAPLSDGTHSVAARATQGASTSTDSASLSVVVDTLAPAVAITDGPSGTVVDSQATITFTNEAGAAMTCALDAAPSSSCTSPVSFSSLGAGGHGVVVQGSDAAGNTATATRNWTVALPDAPDAPMLDVSSDTGASTTDGITRADPITLIGTCTNGDSVRLEEGNVPLGSAVVCSGGYSIALTGLSEGTHALKARVTRNGLTSDSGAAVAVIVDRHIDAPSLLGSAGPVAPASDVNGTTEPGASIVVREAATTLCSATAGGGGDWTCTVSFTSGGLHHLDATATDIAGNTSAAYATLDLDVDLLFRDGFEQ